MAKNPVKRAKHVKSDAMVFMQKISGEPLICNPYDFLIATESEWRELVNTYDTLGDYFDSYGLHSEADFDPEKANEGLKITSRITCAEGDITSNHAKNKLASGFSLSDSHGLQQPALQVTTFPNQNQGGPVPQEGGGGGIRRVGGVNDLTTLVGQGVQAEQQAVNNFQDPNLAQPLPPFNGGDDDDWGWGDEF